MSAAVVVCAGKSAYRSASLRPHHGARSTASHANLSAKCANARVNTSKSCTTGRRSSFSILIARNRSPTFRNCGIISSYKTVRVRPRIAMVADGSSRRTLITISTSSLASAA